MNAAIFGCPAEWARLLPPGTRRVLRSEELTEHIWPLLALTPEGCQALAENQAASGKIACRLLLAPGELQALPPRLQAETVISYGLSPRDSLTLSSLRSPVLCVQRVLPRPNGRIIDAQEFPLSSLPGPAEAILPLLGLRLLQMPLTEGRFP